MPPPAAADNPLEFTADQDQVVVGLSSALKMVALALLLLAAVRLGRGFIELLYNVPLLIFYAIEGLLTGFLGLVLLSVADDTKFITTTEKNDRIHLFNAVDSLNVYTKVLLGLGVLVIVVESLRLLF